MEANMVSSSVNYPTFLTDGDDVFYGEDNVGQWVYGKNGNDTIYGGMDAYNNQLYGQGGNDTLIGGNYTDYLYGGTGNDTMSGLEGKDQYYIDSAGDIVIEKENEGSDTVYSTIHYTLTANVEDLILQQEFRG
jgi:Ca2+-binding RTX toxin-like protein